MHDSTSEEISSLLEEWCEGVAKHRGYYITMVRVTSPK